MLLGSIAKMREREVRRENLSELQSSRESEAARV